MTLRHFGGSLTLDGRPISYALASLTRDFLRLRFEHAVRQQDVVSMRVWASEFGQITVVLDQCLRWRRAAGWRFPEDADHCPPPPEIEAELWRARMEVAP